MLGERERKIVTLRRLAVMLVAAAEIFEGSRSGIREPRQPLSNPPFASEDKVAREAQVAYEEMAKAIGAHGAFSSPTTNRDGGRSNREVNDDEKRERVMAQRVKLQVGNADTGNKTKVLLGMYIYTYP